MIFQILDTVLAFTGPPSDPYSGYGAIKVEGLDVSLGTANPQASATLLITGNDSTLNNFGLIIENLNSDQNLKIRNDGVLGIGKDLDLRAPDHSDMTHGFSEPYYIFQADSLFTRDWRIERVFFDNNEDKSHLFADTWETTGTINGFASYGLPSKIINFTNIEADSFTAGLTPASNVIGYPDSLGVFGQDQGEGIYAFPRDLAINTSSILGIPAPLSVYGSGFFATSTYIGIGTTTDPGLLNIGNDNAWLSGISKGIKIESQPSVYGAIELGAGTPSTDRRYGLHVDSANNALLIYDSPIEFDPSPFGFIGLVFDLSFKGGKIGILGISPQVELDVVTGTTKTTAFQLATTTTNVTGYVLSSADAFGNANWQSIDTLPGSANSGDTLRSNGASWIANSALFNNGSNVGVGTASPAAGTLLEVGPPGYFRFAKFSSGSPSSTDPTGCDSATETGRLTLDTTNNRLYLCTGAPGWGRAPTFWYADGWNNRRKITLQSSEVDGVGDLINFPALIDLTGNINGAQADYDDIVFTLSDGITKLAHEVETSTTNVFGWVKIPTLSGTNNTDIYVYYGNSGASNQQNPSGVWDLNYKGVWHLAEDVPDTDTGSISNAHNDSTSNNHDGDRINNSEIAGKIGLAQKLDGSTDYIRVTPYNANLDGDTITMSAWVNFDSLVGGLDGIVARGNTDDAYNIILETTPDTMEFRVRKGTGFSSIHSGVVNTTDWYYVTLTHSGNTLEAFVNGSSIGTDTNTSAISRLGTPIYFGHYNLDDLNGIIDEVHISNVVRSNEWIKTSYNNQNNPSSFYSFSAEE